MCMWPRTVTAGVCDGDVFFTIAIFVMMAFQRGGHFLPQTDQLHWM